MANSAFFAGFCAVLSVINVCYGFPVDLSTVGSGQLSSVWLASSPVFAVIVLFVIVIALFGCVCCRPGNSFKEFRNSNDVLGVAEEGFVNPRAGAELTIFPPLGAAAPNTNSVPVAPIRLEVPAESKHALRPASFSSSERPLSSQDWFYEPHLNFPRGQLQYQQDYGRGWFGRIVEGEAALITPPHPRSKVIVKILHEDATPTDQMFFLHEVKAHRDLNHANILRLLGRCLEKEPFLLLLEHCPNGDLKTFLTQNLASASALTEQGIILRMSKDITSGLDFMHQHKFIHTDLAARNCLVTPDLTIKIGDYGNSIELFREDYYIAGSVALPVRWCAPETLRCTDVTIETKEVTTFANVWTLAVVIWELNEFGKLPYGQLTDDQVIVKVLGDKTCFLQPPRMDCLFKDEIYHLMKLCWNPPLQRPTVAQIKVILENLVSSGKTGGDGTTHLDFDERWHQSKPNTIPKTDNADIPARPHGAKVADSSMETPIGAFGINSKPIGLESPRFCLKKSDSVQNVSGSLERLNETAYKMEEGELDSWLKGVEVNNEEDEKFVRNISEAIRDLDAALAMEKTSSSEEASGKSSKENSPGRNVKISNQVQEFEPVNKTVDFKLGGDTSSYMSVPPKSFELSSLQNTIEPQSLTFASLIFPEVKQDSSIAISIVDAEEEIWRTRIERGEFTEKVKEKSKSIADLMILTHIDPSDDSDDTERERNSFTWKPNNRNSLTSANFGSESDLRHAILEEGFSESLKKLSFEHKEFGRFDSLNMIVPDQARRGNLLKTLESNPVDNHIFLGNIASDKNDNTEDVQYRACSVSEALSSSQNTKDGASVVDDVITIVPEINVHEAENDANAMEEVEEEEFKVEYERKPLKFVLKEEPQESSVVLGPFDDHSLSHYQGVRTTFGNAAIIENWNEHLETALNEQLSQNNFDNVTFQSLEMKSEDDENQENVAHEPIINKITNLSDNVWSEEELDGKLRTPDDERSSDSGFRDKGSLSESVEDACEGKYNLEDIEAELEEAFVKGAFNTTEEEADKKEGINFEFEETKFYEDESKNDEDLSDVDGEIEMWQPGEKEYFPEMSDLRTVTADGWYLHPPDDENNTNEDLEDEFVNALRNELQEKLPMPCRSFEIDEEADDFLTNNHTINIQYNHSMVLSPIVEEESGQAILTSPSGSSKQRRSNNICGLLESVKSIDTETFMQYLDYMVEKEGKDDEGLLIEDDNCIAEEDNIPMIVITKDVQQTSKNTFEEDIKTALGYEDDEDGETVTDGDQPKSIVVFEDLEEASGCQIIKETKPEDEVLLVNTSTNEVKLLDSPKPKSQDAFLNGIGEFTPDSISPDRDLSTSDESSQGEASTDINSSPDLLSDFLITPDKTPFESPRTAPKITIVEELKRDDDAAEIVGELLRSGVLKKEGEQKSGCAELHQNQQPPSGLLPHIPHKLNWSMDQFLNNERIHTTDLLLESSKKLEKFEMSTSFMGDDDEDDQSVSKEGNTDESGLTSEKMEGTYTPDWESESGDEVGSSSSSGEFIWKDGGLEAKVKVKQASATDADISLQENSKSEATAETDNSKNDADSNDDDDGDDSSSDSASISDFVPCAWDSQATPAKSALRSPDKKTDSEKRRVSFKKEKYQCIYEYPREPSDHEESEKSQQAIDYSQFADWDLQDVDTADSDETLDSDLEGTTKASSKKYDFYSLSPFDDLENVGTFNDDGEFYVSSSTRPFQSGAIGPVFTGSQFTAFGSTQLWPTSPTIDNLLDENDFTTPDSGVEDLCGSTPGESPPETDTSEGPMQEDRSLSPNAVPSDDGLSKSFSPGLGIGSSRPARDSLTLDLPKSHNAELGLVINGFKSKDENIDGQSQLILLGDLHCQLILRNSHPRTSILMNAFALSEDLNYYPLSNHWNLTSRIQLLLSGTLSSVEVHSKNFMPYHSDNE